jgi:hypothetical protein
MGLVKMFKEGNTFSEVYVERNLILTWKDMQSSSKWRKVKGLSELHKPGFI